MEEDERRKWKRADERLEIKNFLSVKKMRIQISKQVIKPAD